MNKISLKNLNLKEVEQLSREQLKGVLGGQSVGLTMEYDKCVDTCGGIKGQCDQNSLCVDVECIRDNVSYLVQGCVHKGQ